MQMKHGTSVLRYSSSASVFDRSTTLLVMVRLSAARTPTVTNATPTQEFGPTLRQPQTLEADSLVRVTCRE